jgi:hypothetical protein
MPLTQAVGYGEACGQEGNGYPHTPDVNTAFQQLYLSMGFARLWLENQN